MSNNEYENLRNQYKPDRVEVLFVGESRPQRGTFFYQGDSILYKETKKAFDEFLQEDIFTLEMFKNCKCWLYDICESPVNGLPNHERNAEIHRNIPALADIIKTLNPKVIIVCKMGSVRDEIRQSNIMDNYAENESIFFLPFPLYQNNIERYREGLVRALGKIDFTYA